MINAPGTLRPDADIAELREAIEDLRQKMAVLGAPLVRSEPRPTRRPTAFLIMPFGPEDLQVVYGDFIRPTIENKCGLDSVRGDDMFGSNVVMDDIRAAIGTSKIVIADLTGRNANVFYEVGVAHTMEKPVLLLAQSAEDVPFNLRHRRVLVYDYTPRGCKLLERRLEEHVCAMIGNGQ